jgi:hypothetical protein
MQDVQIFLCKSCGKYFSDSPARNATYPLRIMLDSISLYNLGYTQDETSRIISRRFRVHVPRRTISSWIKRHEDVCTFSRMRRRAVALYPPESMISSKRLFHQQTYLFAVHRAKLELLKNEIPENKSLLLRSYLDRIPTEDFPHHIFGSFRPGPGSGNSGPGKNGDGEKRASRMSFSHLEITRAEKMNRANVLAAISLKTSPDNRARHETVQDFMLRNDSSTVAVEVPVYLTSSDISYFRGKGFTLEFENSRTPITGHIDILQIRNGMVHILDYKPQAEKVDAVRQLTIYALALASRTKLAVRDFKCAWFDDKNYYEFFPLHAVYRK